MKRLAYFGNWAYTNPSPYKFFPENLTGHHYTHAIYAFAAIDTKTFQVDAHSFLPPHSSLLCWEVSGGVECGRVEVTMDTLRFQRWVTLDLDPETL